MDGLRVLQGESERVFSEGIGLVLSRWSALQTAVENEWGGRDSNLRAQQLAADVLSWFTQSKEPLYIDDLEDMLDEGMLSLNLEVQDGSVEEVAENLMVMHGECLEGNFRSIEILREANLKQAAHPRVPQIVNGDEDEDDEDDGNDENIIGAGNSSNMDVDIPNSEPDMNSANNRPVTAPHPNVSAEPGEDGWSVVSNRKNRGRRN